MIDSIVLIKASNCTPCEDMEQVLDYIPVPLTVYEWNDSEAKEYLKDISNDGYPIIIFLENEKIKYVHHGSTIREYILEILNRYK